MFYESTGMQECCSNVVGSIAISLEGRKSNLIRLRAFILSKKTTTTFWRQIDAKIILVTSIPSRHHSWTHVIHDNGFNNFRRCHHAWKNGYDSETKRISKKKKTKLQFHIISAVTNVTCDVNNNITNLDSTRARVDNGCKHVPWLSWRMEK